MTGIY
jgi:LytS/YehU family sensor histidine kinase